MAIKYEKLTRENIRALQVGERLTERGITAKKLEDGADGDVHYSINVMAGGQRIHRAVGRASDRTTRTQCEDLIAKVRTEAKEGRLSLPKGRSTPLTFKAASKLYLEGQEESGADNLEAKERHIRLHLNPYFGNMQVERIAPFTLKTFRKRSADKGLAPATVNRILATYRHMAKWLLEEKELRDPMPNVTLTAEDNQRDYVLSASEEKRLLNAALKDSNTYIWLFIKVGLGSALRHSEILSARFDRFDAEKRRLRVWVKPGRWRDQPLTRELTKILAREREMAADQDGFIFPSTRTKSGHIRNLDRAFKRCVKRAGLDPIRVVPHVLRHTAITRIAEAAPGDIATVKKFSGHKSIQMVLRYTHPSDQLVDQALDRMEEMGTEQEQEAPAKGRAS